jgi:hypothetical protein
MTSRRAVAYIGGASLLLAWLAAASGDARRVRAPRAPSPPSDDALMQTIASDVQAQAIRLRQRLASAPAPSPVRNPFAFDAREARPSRRAAAAEAMVEPAPPAIVEPAFTLVGIAEQKTPVGLIRTAMLAVAGDDLIMVREGQTVALRYRVTAIGQDVIELTDVTTGATRRLALQQ